MVAKRNAATQAMGRLAGFEGKVVTFTKVSYTQVKGKRQLQLNEDFDVFEAPEEVRGQYADMKCPIITMPMLKQQQDYSRVNLDNLVLQSVEPVNPDCNGKGYRGVRLVDSSGTVVKAMVWGDLAHANVWKKNDVVDLRQVEINRRDSRLDLRTFSQVSKSANGVKLPSRLSFVSFDP